MHTPPTQPFNTQLPQSFNPEVPPPYFPQYPPTNSPSANSTDSSILLALQKQWERQERLDMECNEIERQKEERKRMKEEREQRKEDRKQVEKRENQQRSRINKAFEKIPRFDDTNPSYCFDWLEQTEALVNEHQGRIYREELLLNCGTSISKTIHRCHKELLTSTSKMRYYETIPTSEWCHSNQMPIINCIRSPMRHCKLTTQGMHLSLT